MLVVNNYVIFNERALLLPQIYATKNGLLKLASKSERNYNYE